MPHVSQIFYTDIQLLVVFDFRAKHFTKFFLTLFCKAVSVYKQSFWLPYSAFLQNRFIHLPTSALP